MPDTTNTAGGASLLTIEAILAYCKNWFRVSVVSGTFRIIDGFLNDTGGCLADGQYYRIIGSVFNDGLHKYGDADDTLTDETFSGAIWPLAIPPALISVAAEIDDWRGRYEDMLASPISSESFGGYSYTKSGAAGTGTGGQTWQDIFAAKLNRWRKIYGP